MSRSPGYSVDEIRGRLLYQQLQEEARAAIEAYEWGPPAEAPAVPHLVRTDTGSLRAIVVAS